MFKVFQDAAMLKDTWVIYQAVRNSFDDLTRFICLLLLQGVVFVSEERLPAAADLPAFWILLGVPADTAAMLSHNLRLWMDPTTGLVHVSKEWASREDENTMEVLTNILLMFMECKTFSETRWASMRDNSRMMVGAIAVGFQSLVKFVRRQPHMLHEHLGGFDKLDSRQISFLICSMLVGLVVERAACNHCRGCFGSHSGRARQD